MGDWVRRNWVFLVCGLVMVMAVGVGGRSILGFRAVQDEAMQAAAMANDIQQITARPVNQSIINAEKKYIGQIEQEKAQARQMAWSVDRRDPLRADVFPVAAISAPYEFRIDYAKAMTELLKRLNGSDAPSGDMVQRIADQLLEKYEKKAKMGVGKLNIPQPPTVQQIQTQLPAASSVGFRDPLMDRGDDRMAMRPGMERPGSGRPGGMRPGSMRPGSMRPGMRGDQDMMRPGYDRRDASPRTTFRRSMPMPSRAPSGSALSEPTGPSLDELNEQATKNAIYTTAESIWTYASEDSFQWHPMVDSDQEPQPTEMWDAQMLLWIQQDIVEALRGVNEAVTQALPEDQRWVAYLPVKHLLSVSISNYLTGGATGQRGRSVGGRMASGRSDRSRRSRSGFTSRNFAGSVEQAFTKRSRHDLYDVIQFELVMVVDARDVPMIVNELCKKRLFTPLVLSYEAVDSLAARGAGYLYGSEPTVCVTMVCEALFLRKNYEALMPKDVKDLLEGAVAPPAQSERDMYRR